MVGDISGADRAVVATRTPLHFGRIVVIGGGCYGAWYTQQLAKAIARGAVVAREIIVVDHNAHCLVSQRLERDEYGTAPVRVVNQEWNDYVATWLASGTDALNTDTMVPSPLMPHLCLDWLLLRARARFPEREISVQPLTVTPPTPWERAAPDGRHYVSFATWTCPINCIEPARCPATRETRDWSMPVAITRYAQQQSTQVDASLIFHCEHRAYGVGMIDAAGIAAGDDLLAAWTSSAPLRILVGTVSHCHGALGVLTVR